MVELLTYELLVGAASLLRMYGPFSGDDVVFSDYGRGRR